MGNDQRTEHVCQIVSDNGYCDCKDIPNSVLKITKEVLPDVMNMSSGKLKEYLFNSGPATLVCKNCKHLGMLTVPIVGLPPGAKPGSGASNAEDDFAICPRCGHCTYFHIRIGVKRGDEV